MLVKGIHHVALKCTNMDDYNKTLAFYCDILGLKVLRTWPTATMVDTGNGILEIFNNATEAIHEEGAIRHFAFLVESADACVETVRAAGYEVFDGPRDVTIPSATPYDIRVAFCYGPTGEIVEFFQER